MSSLSCGAKIGIAVAVLGSVLGVGMGIGVPLLLLWGQMTAREPLPVRLDQTGPYLLLASRKAEKSYTAALARARQLHPQAAQALFDPEDLAGARKVLQEHRPRYALVFLEPQELDVNFAWQWLMLTTQLDDDPFVDVRTGFITGATPEAAARFVERIQAAVRGERTLPGAVVDDLGPNTQAGKHAFSTSPGCFMAPVLARRLRARSIGHGTEAFDEQRLTSLDGAGLVHFGGHGHPDRVDDGVTGAQAGRLQLAPCVVFNGACYTGVTHRWYDASTGQGKVAEQTVPPTACFCLNLLANQAVAYLAALYPDHGLPVYQEMEYLAYRGGPLGDVIKHTHDGVVLAAGGQLPAFERFAAGMPSPQWTPSEVMLKGTASRVLFGDPALIVLDPFTEPPFQVTVKEARDSLAITAVLANTELKSTYTDTYHADLAADKNLFNDRALVVAELPAGWTAVRKIEVLGVKAGGQALPQRLVGYAVESDGGRHSLHVQVDVPTTGFMQSPLRVAGATVELRASR